jgi:hypothetical protein
MQHLYMDTCNATNDHQQYYAQNGEAIWGGRFELNPVFVTDGCVGDTHQAKYSELIYVWKCEVSRIWETSLWNFY